LLKGFTGLVEGVDASVNNSFNGFFRRKESAKGALRDVERVDFIPGVACCDSYGVAQAPWCI
jgi:hypothetical protein